MQTLSINAPQKPSFGFCDGSAWREWSEEHQYEWLIVLLKQDGFGVTARVYHDTKTNAKKLVLCATKSGNPIPILQCLHDKILKDLNYHTGVFFLEWLSKDPSVHKHVDLITGEVVPGKHAFFKVSGVWNRKEPMSQQYFEDNNFVLMCWGKSDGENGYERLMNARKASTVDGKIYSVEIKDGVTTYPPDKVVVACKWYSEVRKPDELATLFASITAQAGNPKYSPIEGLIVHLEVPNPLVFGGRDYRSKFLWKFKSHFYTTLQCVRYDSHKNCGYVLLDGVEQETMPIQDKSGDMQTSFRDKKRVYCFVICWYVAQQAQQETRCVYAKFVIPEKKPSHPEKIRATEQAGAPSSKLSKLTAPQCSDKKRQRNTEQAGASSSKPPTSNAPQWSDVRPPAWDLLPAGQHKALEAAVNNGRLSGYNTWDEWTTEYCSAFLQRRSLLWNILMKVNTAETQKSETYQTPCILISSDDEI